MKFKTCEIVYHDFTKCSPACSNFPAGIPAKEPRKCPHLKIGIMIIHGKEERGFFHTCIYPRLSKDAGDIHVKKIDTFEGVEINIPYFKKIKLPED